MEFSTRAVHRLIKAQSDKRVFEAASNKLGDILETFAGDIAEEAVALAEEEGYQTIKRKHIREAPGH
jgi:histone H3/H4